MLGAVGEEDCDDDGNYANALSSVVTRVESDEEESEEEDGVDHEACSGDADGTVVDRDAKDETSREEGACQSNDGEKPSRHLGIETLQKRVRGVLARNWFNSQRSLAEEATGVDASSELGHKLVSRYMRTHHRTLFAFPPAHIIIRENGEDEGNEGKLQRTPPGHTDFSWYASDFAVREMIANGHTQFSAGENRPGRIVKRISGDEVLKRWPKVSRKALSSSSSSSSPSSSTLKKFRPLPLNKKLIDLGGADPSPSLISPRKNVSPRNISAGNSTFVKHRPPALSPIHCDFSGADPLKSYSPRSAASASPFESESLTAKSDSPEPKEPAMRGRFKKPAKLRASQVDLGGVDFAPSMGSSFRESKISFEHTSSTELDEVAAVDVKEEEDCGNDFSVKAHTHRSMPAAKTHTDTTLREHHSSSSLAPGARPPRPKESMRLPAPPPPEAPQIPIPPPPPPLDNSPAGISVQNDQLPQIRESRGSSSSTTAIEVPEHREELFFRMMKKREEERKAVEAEKEKKRLELLTDEERREEEQKKREAEAHTKLQSRMLRAHLGRSSVTRKQSILKGRRRKSSKKT